MRRALIALVLTPLLASGVFGVVAVIAYPIMLVVTFAIALPLLIFFKRLQRLNWWHALIAGAFCGLCFVIVDTLLTMASVSPAFLLDNVVNSNNVYFVGLGALTGFAYWWAGIYRNPAFPFVGRSFPVGVLLVLPVSAATIYVHQALRPAFYQGRVIAIITTPNANPRAGQASVRLTGGRVVQGDLSNTWTLSMVVGHCIHVEERWSTLRFRRVYELGPPFVFSEDC